MKIISLFTFEELQITPIMVDKDYAMFGNEPQTGFNSILKSSDKARKWRKIPRRAKKSVIDTNYYVEEKIYEAA